MLIYNNIIFNILKNFSFKLPINYIIKKKKIFKKKYKILYPVLIPRNETIKIIELSNYILIKSVKDKILELGIGSGIINISLNKLFNLKINLIDSNYNCIMLSIYNSKKLIKNEYIFLHNWFFLKNKEHYDLIVANPPYLYICDLYFYNLSLELKKSLVSKKKGLKDIYKIINLSYKILNVNGKIFIEHAYNQATYIRFLFNLFGFINICTKTDYSKMARVTYGEK